ncbi:MAG: substrate binding domain-containing protein, partial [Sideroxyarcus sp.]|nr:substrate binding domain-containing protein [Sideroxyarcus sp.]
QNAELSASERATRASGHLVVSAPAGFGRRHVAPLIPAFLAAHPEVTVTLSLDDRVVNLAGEGVDVGIRIAAHADPSLIGVKLADNRRVVVAAPSYLAAKGRPTRLEDLALHNCLTMGNDGSQRGWSFRQNSRPILVKVSGTMCCNDGSVLHDRALAGKGLAWRSLWEVGAELESGELVAVLDQFAAPGDDIYAVYAQRQYLPVRIRAFVDFLRQHYGRTGRWSAT